MRVHSTARLAAFTALVGALACASNKPRTETEPDQAAAARDTTTVGDTTGRDTLNGQAPSGYHGMERDTTQVPSAQQTPTDTFLQNQGQGQPQDTAGYSGMERVDTTGQRAQPSQTDTTGFGRDTTGGAGAYDTSSVRTDSSQVNPSSSNQSGLDSTGVSRSGDTTGYTPSQQQPRDSTSRY